jgi:DMSO/TMAO reductase YedYZ molybdopterin-dependent catalytic subunit
VAEASQGIGADELQLATRNHGMPLEALRFDLTPAGLHYVLVHYDIPDAARGWRLEVGGAVRSPLALSLEDLRSRPRTTLPVTLECAGNGRAFLDPRPISQPWLLEAVGTAEWTGTPLSGLLEEASPADGAVEVLFTGADRGIEGEEEQEYERSLPLAEAVRPEVLVAYEMNGDPLPPQHGFPLRLIVPGWYGMAHVKWLRKVTVLTEPFAGYQQARGYRMRSAPDEPGEPVTRLLPRSLMIPPGIPDFMTRTRYVEAGTVVLRGRAWSGLGPITRVDVSWDGGWGWHEAALDPPVGPFAWCGWRFEWDAPRGELELLCRASDETGAVQPLHPRWNLGGYQNNAVQRVRVVVR